MRDDFLSAAEIAFFRVLCEAAPDGSIVLAKIRVADVLHVVDRREHHGHFNRISAKHVDFLIVEPHRMRPIVAIELDDASHRRESRRASDELKDAAFHAAGLPLLRFAVAPSYDARAIRSHVEAVIGSRMPVAVVPPPPVPRNAEPSCPKCGVPMALRTAKRGAEVGRHFWGCVNYPRCRQTIEAVG